MPTYYVFTKKHNVRPSARHARDKARREFDEALRAAQRDRGEARSTVNGTNQSISINDDNQQIFANGTNQKILAQGTNQKIFAKGTNEEIVANGTNQKIFAQGTNQRIVANGTNQQIYANGTNQEIYANGTNPKIFANGTNQRIFVNGQRMNSHSTGTFRYQIVPENSINNRNTHARRNTAIATQSSQHSRRNTTSARQPSRDSRPNYVNSSTENSSSNAEGLTDAEIKRFPTHKLTRDEGICSICMENYIIGKKDKRVNFFQANKNTLVRTLPCTHYFHAKCIDPWLTTNASCPECRCKFK